MAGLKLVVVSGLSGSGKSHALKCFEDVGYFCVDNLPPALLPTFVELCHQQGGEIKNVALGIDVRERVFFSDLVGILERVKVLGHSVELMFFEARIAIGNRLLVQIQTLRNVPVLGHSKKQSPRTTRGLQYPLGLSIHVLFEGRL